MPIVKKMQKKSLAERAGIVAGDDILSFNGNKFNDILDYVYAEGQDELIIEVKSKDKESRRVKIVKRNIYSELGMEFDSQIDIEPRGCANKCIFCFVDQLPKGMRETLYVKDDDYRLSFISGSYITLTNLTKRDIDRIIHYKLSPLYVSVHAADQNVWKSLTGCKRDINPVEILKSLTENGIKLHTQIVMVPNINDNLVLKETLNVLYELGENILSVAVVPVGLTMHRENLYNVIAVDKQKAQQTIDIVEEFYQKHNYFCYCSDEMYEIAQKDVKDYEYYGDFCQIENGVGLVAKLFDEVKFAVDNCEVNKLNKKIAVITGSSGKNVMEKLKEIMTQKWKKLKFDIFPIKNDFFGHSVTVSGLITGGDIIKQLQNVDLSVYDQVFIPSVMLKEFESVFLDNITLRELEESLKIKVTAVAVDGDLFVDTVVYGGE